MRVRNVVVFGDSLSDIGLKVQTYLGKFAKNVLGAVTVSPSGRFSDCRNWTDHMYEAATGNSLIKGTKAATMAASRPHQTLTSQSLVMGNNVAHGPGTVLNPKRFYYANYAVGGDCGGIPSNMKGKFGLGEFKDQVKRFETDWRRLHGATQQRDPADDELKTLFLVWFGANDLYTAKCSEMAMADVARKVARKRRRELVDIVGAQNARFAFVNLAPPLSSVRYQQRLQNGAVTDQDIRRLETGVALYNGILKGCAMENGDGYVDIARAVEPGVLRGILLKLNLIDGTAQPQGTSNRHISSAEYDVRAAVRIASLPPNRAVATSDLAHPTDPIYRYMWKNIKKEIGNKQWEFGNV